MSKSLDLPVPDESPPTLQCLPSLPFSYHLCTTPHARHSLAQDYSPKFDLNEAAAAADAYACI